MDDKTKKLKPINYLGRRVIDDHYLKMDNLNVSKETIDEIMSHNAAECKWKKFKDSDYYEIITEKLGSIKIMKNSDLYKHLINSFRFGRKRGHKSYFKIHLDNRYYNLDDFDVDELEEVMEEYLGKALPDKYFKHLDDYYIVVEYFESGEEYLISAADDFYASNEDWYEIIYDLNGNIVESLFDDVEGVSFSSMDWGGPWY